MSNVSILKFNRVHGVYTGREARRLMYYKHTQTHDSNQMVFTVFKKKWFIFKCTYRDILGLTRNAV